MGFDLRSISLYEDGNSSLQQYDESDHIGHSHYVDSGGNENYTIYGKNSYFYDNAGSDTVTIKSGASAIFSNDGSATDSNTVVLEDMAPADIEMSRVGNALVVTDAVTEDVIFIEHNHFKIFGTPTEGVTTLKFKQNGTIDENNTIDLTNLTSSLLSGFSDITDMLMAFGGAYADILDSFGVSITQIDPLVLDLDRSGGLQVLETVGVNGAYFDIDSDGFAESMPWIGPNDGFLVYDVNANGTIDNGGELFGTATVNGFTILAGYDSNSDDAINSSDAIWTDLKVWQDLNSDAVSQADELFTMAEVGFTSIDLAGAVSSSTVTTTTTDMDIINWLPPVNQQNTRYAGDVDIAFETLFLPQLRGYANMTDLRIAMNTDYQTTGNVRERVDGLAQQSLVELFEDLGATRAEFDALLYRWADVHNVSPTSRGIYLDDARKLEFLENYVGQEFTQARFPEPNPLSLAAEQIMAMYEDIRDHLLATFVFQSTGSSLFETEGYYYMNHDRIAFDSAIVLDTDGIAALGTAAASTANPEQFWANVAFFIEQIRGNLDGLTTAETDALDNAIQLADPLLSWADVKDGYLETADQVLDGDASGASADTLTGGTGNDTISGYDLADTLKGGAGQDVIDGGDGDDSLWGEAGHDHLIGGAGNDTLRDGSGSDLLEGGLGDETYIWEGGNDDYIYDEGGNDSLVIANHASIVFERVFVDDLLLRIGSDTLTLQDQLNDPLQVSIIESIKDSSLNVVYDMTNFTGQIITQGTDLNDTIIGVEYGGSINDVINGYGGDDLVTAGLGDDVVHGGAGSDTYIYDAGVDVYQDTGGALDVIEMGAAIVFEDIEIYRIYKGEIGNESTDTNLEIKIDENNLAILQYHFDASGDNEFETLRFNDSTPDIDLTTYNFTTYGNDNANEIEAIVIGSGNETIYARGGNDIIHTAGGADTLYGGAGNDLIDVTELTALAGHAYHGGETGLTLADDGNDTINFDFNKSGAYGLLIDITDISNGTAQAYNYGTAGVEGNIDTLASIENITALHKSNMIYAGSEDNIITTGAGNDVIYGGGGNDTLIGGGGSDELYGEGGADIYQLGQGGSHVVTDTSGTADAISFNSITDQANVEFLESGDDLIVSGVSGASLTLTDQVISNTIEKIIFNEFLIIDFDYNSWTLGTISGETLNGTTGADVIIGKDGNDTINGDAGDDILYSVSGSNTINGGAGHDTISGTMSGNDTINGGDGNDFIYAPAGIATIHGDNDDDRIYINNVSAIGSIYGDAGIDTADFSYHEETGISGLSISLQGTYNGTHDFNMYTFENVVGSGFNDTLVGDSSSNVFEGGRGDDIMNALGGDDTYVFNMGDGQDLVIDSGGSDIIEFRDVSVADLAFWQSGNNLQIDNVNSSDQITIQDYFVSATDKIESFVFGADTYGLQIGTSGNDTLNGGAGYDILFSGSGADTISGGGGNNVLAGGVDNDALNGGGADDVYILNAGDGQDTISDSDGVLDVIRLGAGIGFSDLTFTDTGTYDLDITFAGSTDKITILNQRDSGSTNQIEKIVFADDSEYSLVLDTSVANTYEYGIGDGDITINDSADEDMIVFDATVAPEDMIFTDVGNNLEITFSGQSGKITIVDHLDTLATKRVEWVRFSDYSELDLTRYNDWIMGTPAGETVNGNTTLDDIVYGGDGADTINGYSGDDILSGGEGNDYINPGGGADIVFGGNGNDTIEGYGSGNILVGGLGKDNVNAIGASTIYDVALINGQISDPFADTNYDNLNGGSNADTIIAQAMHNNLNGKEGDDTYKVYFHADGTAGSNNSITDISGNDTLILASLAYTDTNWYLESTSHQGFRFVYTGTSTDSYVTIGSQFTGYDGTGTPVFAIDHVTFADQTSLDFLDFFNILGSWQTETHYGTTGDDYIVTFGGGDTVHADLGNDYIRGGDGNDILHGEGGNDLIGGYDGNDEIHGGDGDDRLWGEDGADTLYGDAGNDVIYGHDGNDIIYGGLGTDNLHGNDDDDELHGGDDADSVFGENGYDTLYGDAGNDTLKGGNQDDTLYGGDGADWLYGQQHNDTLYGGDGNDTLYGEQASNPASQVGHDTLYGEAGNDVLWGNYGDDTLYGGDGYDSLFGQAGADTFVFEAATAFNDADGVRDFSQTENDTIDISDVLSTGYDPLTDVLTDFVQITDNGTHSYLYVDSDGGADNFLQIATIFNVTGITDEEALVTSGHLLVA